MDYAIIIIVGERKEPIMKLGQHKTMARRKTVEVLGINNGQTVCVARKKPHGWLCYACMTPQDSSVQPTMKAAEAELLNMGATRITRCPELQTLDH